LITTGKIKTLETIQKMEETGMWTRMADTMWREEARTEDNDLEEKKT